MEKTHHHNEKTADDIAHCNRYFDRPHSNWDYEGFLSHCSTVGSFSFSLLNSRYIKSLEAIECCRTETQGRRKKARSLIGRHKAGANLRRSKGTTDTHWTIVHGDVIGEVNAAGDFISGDFNAVGDLIRVGDFISAGDSVSAGSHVLNNTTGPSTLKRTAEPTTGLSKRRTTDRNWEETLTLIPPLVAVDALPTAKDPITSEPYSSSTSRSPPPQAADPYSNIGDFPYDIDFVTSYLAMTHKRTLSTGKILEDHIYHEVRPTPPDSEWLYGNPILQWIVDLQDQVVAAWFTEAEMAELRNWGPQLPLRDPAFEYAVNRFPKVPTSSEQLWGIIESPSRPSDEPYDHARHSTANYVNSAAGSILSTIELYSTCPWLGPKALYEGWFSSNLWSPLIDRCLHSIPKLAVSRTEMKVRSSQNGNLRFDTIIHAQLVNDVMLEFGAVEVARVAVATAAGKQEGDAEKLVRVLRDMLAAVERSVQGDEDAMEKVQVVGIQNVGFKMSMYTMHMLGKNVAVLYKGHGRCVPMAVKEFGKVVDVMRGVVRAKRIVQRSMEAVIEWNEKGRRRVEDEL